MGNVRYKCAALQMTDGPTPRLASAAPVLAPQQRTSEYLAAERTFLAWIRTSIAIISLGFVVAKFGLWLRELAIRFDPQHNTPSTGMSLPMGVGMMAFGSLLAVLAAWQFFAVDHAIARRTFEPNRRMVIFTSTGVVLLAAVIIAYLLFNTAKV